MSAKSETIFERAEQAVSDGTSAQCTKLIAELRRLRQAEAAELSATRPPETGYHRSSSGAVVGTYRGDAGSEYQAAARSGDADKLQKVIARHAVLDERADQADILLMRLEQRQKTAAETEHREAAPARAKQLIAALPKLLDEGEAALQIFTARRELILASFNELVSLREVNPDTPSLDLLTFRRAGVLLSHRVQRPSEDLSDSTQSAAPRITTPLFGSTSQALGFAAAVLPPPAEGVIAKIKSIVSRITSVRPDSVRPPDSVVDRQVRERMTTWQQERIRLLTEGLTDQAQKLGAPEYLPGSDGRPTFGDAA